MFLSSPRTCLLERGRARGTGERERPIGCLLHSPHWGSNPQSRRVPWPGSKPAAFRLVLQPMEPPAQAQPFSFHPGRQSSRLPVLTRSWDSSGSALLFLSKPKLSNLLSQGKYPGPFPPQPQEGAAGTHRQFTCSLFVRHRQASGYPCSAQLHVRCLLLCTPPPCIPVSDPRGPLGRGPGGRSVSWAPSSLARNPSSCSVSRCYR